ncbi:MAG: ECF transporter S component [Candidatus Izemoplasmatales bacterium]|nr:ECF transporter S component [Candidatus Izemoplasmatales bacterium]
MKEKNAISNREKIREWSILSMFIAIVVVMGMVPMLGFITISSVSFTIIPIPVIIGGIILGRKAGIILGLTFGITSLIRGSMNGGIDFLFILPWISILPRVIFGLLIYDIFSLYHKLIKKRILSLALGFFTASLIHTLLVLPMLATGFPLVFEMPSLYEGVLKASNGADQIAILESIQSFNMIMRTLFAILTFNGIIEALLATVIGSILADRLIAYLEHNHSFYKGGIYNESID